MRGSKTHGYGSKKKHRGKGSKGGKGYAGLKKHKKTWMFKYESGHFGKRGFKSKTGQKIKAINLRDLQKVAVGNEVNVKELGYDKVLGIGELKKPLVIKASYFSKKAVEKIEKVKGKAEKI